MTEYMYPTQTRHLPSMRPEVPTIRDHIPLFEGTRRVLVYTRFTFGFRNTQGLFGEFACVELALHFRRL